MKIGKKIFVTALATALFGMSTIGLAACSKGGVGGGGHNGGKPGGDDDDGGKDPTTYTIQLDANGGTIAAGEKTEYETDSLGFLQFEPDPEIAAPSEHSDYTFQGWSLSSSSSSVIEFPYEFDGDDTIYAVWAGEGDDEPPTPVKGFTITFDAAGGTFKGESAPVTRETSDGAIDASMLPELETRDGVEFKGWFTGENGTGKAVQLETFTGDATVYAYWEKATPKPDVPAGFVATEKGSQDGDTNHPNVYLVGKYGGLTELTKDYGKFVSIDSKNTDTSYVQYTITVTLEVGDEVAIWVPDWTLLCTTLQSDLNAKDHLDPVKHGEETYLKVKVAGSYTFYYKNAYNNDRIWITLPSA